MMPMFMMGEDQGAYFRGIDETLMAIRIAAQMAKPTDTAKRVLDNVAVSYRYADRIMKVHDARMKKAEAQEKEKRELQRAEGDVNRAKHELEWLREDIKRLDCQLARYSSKDRTPDLLAERRASQGGWEETRVKAVRSAQAKLRKVKAEAKK